MWPATPKPRSNSDLPSLGSVCMYSVSRMPCALAMCGMAKNANGLLNAAALSCDHNESPTSLEGQLLQTCETVGNAYRLHRRGLNVGKQLVHPFEHSVHEADYSDSILVVMAQQDEVHVDVLHVRVEGSG